MKKRMDLEMEMQDELENGGMKLTRDMKRQMDLKMEIWHTMQARRKWGGGSFW